MSDLPQGPLGATMGFSKAYIALLAGVALACSSATDAADRQLAIATDRLVYHIDSGDVVQSRLVNRGPEPIYAALPGGLVSVQKQRGLAWVDLGPFWYGTYLVVPYVRVVGAGDSLTGMSLPTSNSHRCIACDRRVHRANRFDGHHRAHRGDRSCDILPRNRFSGRAFPDQQRVGARLLSDE